MGLDLLFKLLLMSIEVSLFYKDMDHNQLPVLFTPWYIKSSPEVQVTTGIWQKESEYWERREKNPTGIINNLVLEWRAGHGWSEEDLRILTTKIFLTFTAETRWGFCGAHWCGQAAAVCSSVGSGPFWLVELWIKGGSWQQNRA